MWRLLKDNWFSFGLLFVAGITLLDSTLTVANMGKWVRAQHGPDIGLFLISLFSGISLSSAHVRQGLTDFVALIVSLVLIFLVAPILALAISLPLPTPLLVGLFLVAVMPTTISSGVVMTAAAGGNTVSALMITAIANTLGVVTVPVSLVLLFGHHMPVSGVVLNKGALMIKIALLVGVPIFIGLFLRRFVVPFLQAHSLSTSVINQCLVLSIVWTGVSTSRQTFLANGKILLAAVGIVVLFHLLMLTFAFTSIKLFKLGPGRREAVIFMGGQKSLPLSIFLQMTYFPQFGAALMVCVTHHITHLVIDSYLVDRLKRRAARDVTSPRKATSVKA